MPREQKGPYSVYSDEFLNDLSEYVEDLRETNEIVQRMSAANDRMLFWGVMLLIAQIGLYGTIIVGVILLIQSVF